MKKSVSARRRATPTALNSEKLAELRTEVERELQRVSRDASPSSELEVRDLAPRARARALQLLEVLRRMETDSFGVCVGCQEAIAYERLAVIPETTVCAYCSGSRELAFQG